MNQLNNKNKMLKKHLKLLFKNQNMKKKNKNRLNKNHTKQIIKEFYII
jgi:hypothetical protein